MIIFTNEKLKFFPAVRGAIEVSRMFNQEFVLMHSGGHVLLQTSEIIAKIACSFDVRKFPFDDQICNFDLEPAEVYFSFALSKYDIHIMYNTFFGIFNRLRFQQTVTKKIDFIELMRIKYDLHYCKADFATWKTMSSRLCMV